MHVVWYTAMSMDGRIASPDDSLDFLETIGPREGSTEEWNAFIAGIDAVVIGGATMRWLVAGGHGWPHDDLPTWLVSRDAALEQVLHPSRAPLTRVEGDLEPMFAAIEAAGHDRVWLCGGGDIAGQALAADRVDEVIVTIAPTVLGAGPALFDAAGLPTRRFTLAECRDAGGDAARLTWLRER